MSPTLECQSESLSRGSLWMALVALRLLQQAALVLEVLALFVLVPLVLTLPGDEKVVSAALVQRDQQRAAVVPPLQADFVLHQVLLRLSYAY